MNLLSPWAWVRARVRPARRHAVTRRLLVEALEERLALSGNSALDAWRSLRFIVSDAARPPAQVTSLGVSTQSQNASFGALIGLNSTFNNLPYKGDGYSVAVLDTGVNYNLGDL